MLNTTTKILKLFRPDILSGNKPVFYIILFFAFVTHGQQNLVPNPSFEEYSSCPVWAGDFYCLNWMVPTLGSSDFYNICSNDVGVPSSTNGFQFPYEGDSYAAIITYYPNGIYREYISIKLLEPLKKNKIYYFSMFINLADSTQRASNNIGVIFRQYDVTNLSGYGVLPYTPDINCDSVILNQNDWVNIFGYYEAEGGEEYLTIGNFYNDNQTKTVQVSSDPDLPTYGAYYFIDNVYLIELDIILPNIITPNNDGVNDILNLVFLPDNAEISIFNRWGEKVFETENANKVFWDGKFNNTQLNNGVYFYTLKIKTIVKTGFIHLIK